jgi:putative DNA primase/helicase
MTAAEIAAALGGAQCSGGWWRCRCPVHGSHGATLALRDGDRALIVKCWAGCDPRTVLAELRRRGLREGDPATDRAGIVKPIARREREGDARKIAAALRIWDAAREAPGSPLAAYLCTRQLTIAPPVTLRWAPRCWHREAHGPLPAMVARVDGPAGEFLGLHRTYLRQNAAGQWYRRERASLGAIGGGAVRLAPAAEALLIGEGIETCLATMQATGLPAWAALSTSGLVTLRLPAIVRAVTILADNDKSGAGERAARAAAQRWLAEGRRVRIAMPPESGTDMADVLSGRAYTRVTEAGDAAA